jgi:hypothetical protein
MFSAWVYILYLHAMYSGSAIQMPVNIGHAEQFAILTKTGITNVPHSVITGDIAVSPISSPAMTGFAFTLDQSGSYAVSSQLHGHKAYAANYNAPIPAHLGIAIYDMESAYIDAAGRVNTNASRINVGGGRLGGAFGGPVFPLTPGVYTFGSGVTITSSIYLQGTDTNNFTYYDNSTEYDNEDIFIIQMSGNLVANANTRVILLNGVLAKNVFWQVAGNVQLMAGSQIVGILLAKTDVTFITGSSLYGRVLAQTACNLQMATILTPS